MKRPKLEAWAHVWSWDGDLTKTARWDFYESKHEAECAADDPDDRVIRMVPHDPAKERLVKSALRWCAWDTQRSPGLRERSTTDRKLHEAVALFERSRKRGGN